MTDTLCAPAGLAGARQTMADAVMGCVEMHVFPAIETEHAGPNPFPEIVTDTLPSELILDGEMLLSVGRM